MHVESVAWISEEKICYIPLYFLLSMLAYIFYLQSHKNKYIYYALACFTISLLAKAQAVTLPVVLLLVDYFSSAQTRCENVP